MDNVTTNVEIVASYVPDIFYQTHLISIFALGLWVILVSLLILVRPGNWLMRLLIALVGFILAANASVALYHNLTLLGWFAQ